MMTRRILALALLFAAAPAGAQTPEPGAARDLRSAMPVTARHEGVWRGTYRRIDADGRVVETFPTEITIGFPRSGPHQYEQTNRYSPAGKPDIVIRTQGAFDGERIRFENARVRGWAVDDRTDANKRTILLFIQNVDGSGYMYESIQISDDGKRRHRVAQYFKADGSLDRRTLIDEARADGTARPAK